MSSSPHGKEATPASDSSATLVSPRSPAAELDVSSMMSSSPPAPLDTLAPDAVERLCDALALQVVQTERLLFQLCGRERGMAALAKVRRRSSSEPQDMDTDAPVAPLASVLPRAPTPQDVVCIAPPPPVMAPVQANAVYHHAAPLPFISHPSSSSSTSLHLLTSAPPHLASPYPRLTRPAIWNFSAQVLAWVVAPTGRRQAPKVRFAPQMSISRVSLKWLRATSAVETTSVVGGGSTGSGSSVLSTLPDRHPCRIRLELWDDRRGGRPSEPFPGSVRSVIVDALLDTGLYDSLLILAHDFIDSQAGRLEEEETMGANGPERRYFARFETLGDFRTEVRAEMKVGKAKDKERAAGVKRGGGETTTATTGHGNKRARE